VRDLGKIILRRAHLNLSILLPIGSEEGGYFLELLDSHGAPRLRTTADGVSRDHVTTLTTRFDLRQLMPGDYALTIQRSASLAVNSYPVEVK
jgi:hypothetical protein